MPETTTDHLATIFFSRPELDRRPPARKASEFVSIHAGANGRYLVFRWAWDRAEREWTQEPMVVAHSLTAAREYVPPGCEPLAVPGDFAIEAWAVRA